MGDPAAARSNDAKKNEGQRGFPMKKISNKNNLVISFCKRRAGLFKKASELCTLCGVQIALIIYSPTNKAYAFGHPNVDSVVDRFLAQGKSNAYLFRGNADPILQRNAATVERLSAEIAELNDRVKKAKELGKFLDQVRNAYKGKSWWKKSRDEMSPLELEDCKKSAAEFMASFSGSKAKASAEPLCLDLTL